MPELSGTQPRHTAVTRNRAGEDYLSFEPWRGRVRGFVGARVVVDSERAMLLREGQLEPVLYFPREDVRLDLLSPGEGSSYCPYRGIPEYYDLDVDGVHVENAAWSYTDPHVESEYVRDYIAFYRERIDRWEHAAETAHLEAPGMAGNPLAGWLLREAWQAGSLPDLVTRWVDAMENAGIRLIRVTLITRTLHPLISGAAYRWTRGEDDIEQVTLRHERLTSPEYLNSPLVPIFEGAGGVRRRLDDNAGADDFPVLADIRAAGGTDYVAMPLVFSDGQINAVTLATDRIGGFTTEELGRVNEVMPLFSRLAEVFIQREKAQSLLTTYLGGQTGRRVLDGRVRRGDGDNIHAVIWFCDLRRSSALAASLPRPAFLEYLNVFFDAMAGAVIDHGGEVLRFIGDAALAIFPSTPDDDGEAPACRRALRAADDAAARIATYNAADDAGETPMEYGIGLHIGDVMYGNIGTASRLEFTVIGAAANEAARIEGLCKTLGQSVLLSEDFVGTCPGDYVTLGRHELPGTGRSVALFATRPSIDPISRSA